MTQICRLNPVGPLNQNWSPGNIRRQSRGIRLINTSVLPEPCPCLPTRTTPGRGRVSSTRNSLTKRQVYADRAGYHNHIHGYWSLGHRDMNLSAVDGTRGVDVVLSGVWGEQYSGGSQRLINTTVPFINQYKLMECTSFNNERSTRLDSQSISHWISVTLTCLTLYQSVVFRLLILVSCST